MTHQMPLDKAAERLGVMQQDSSDFSYFAEGSRVAFPGVSLNILEP